MTKTIVSLGQIGQLIRRFQAFMRQDGNRKGIDRQNIEELLRNPERAKRCFTDLKEVLERCSRANFNSSVETKPGRLQSEKKTASTYWNFFTQMSFYQLMCEAQTEYEDATMHPMFWALFELMKEGEPVYLAYEVVEHQVYHVDVSGGFLTGPKYLEGDRKYYLERLREEIRTQQANAKRLGQTIEQYMDELHARRRNYASMEKDLPWYYVWF